MKTQEIILLALGIINLVWVILLTYYLVNSNCLKCKEHLTAKEILTFKSKCSKCRGWEN